MKKLVMIVSVMVIAAGGCVAQKPAVNVEQNRVHFTLPNLTLELDADYKHLGGDKKSEFSFFDDGGTTGTGISTEQHLFYRGGLGEKQRWIHISYSIIQRSNTIFNPISFTNREGLLRTGTEVLNGAELKYAVYVTTNDSGRCYLQKFMAKTVGATNNRMLRIIYMEEAAHRTDAPYRCNDWQNPERLSPAQQTRLDEFMGNSKREVRAAS